MSPGSRVAALLLGAAVATPAAAAEFCVANVQQLSTAFLIALVSNDVTEIELVRGTYILAGSALDATYASGDDASVGALRMRGGYDPGCGGRTIDPANTILQGVGLSEPSDFITWDFRGDALFEGLSFENFSRGFNPRTIEDDVDITFRRNVFRNGFQPESALPFLWIYQVSSDNVSFTLTNNLFFDNGGACAVDLEATGSGSEILPAEVTVVHNTFADNDGDGLCLQFSNPPAVYNNVAWGNGGVDIRAATTGPLMVRNQYGDYAGPGFFAGSSNNQTGNPQFVNAGAGDFNLQAASPAVNSGNNTTPGGLPGSDIDGGPRLVGTRPDRGAYESAVTDTFFQTVTNANDTGAGSLRQAIVNANAAAGFNIIDFAIAGACPHRIDLGSPLPDVTEALLIDGWSEPGSSTNDAEYADEATRCVRLNGQNARSHALRVADDAGNAVELRVQGIAFGSFTNAAIDLQGGSNHVIQGNYFGDGPAVLDPNRNNIVLGTNASGVRIGGPDLAQRNVLVAALDDAIRIDGGVVGQLPVGSHDNTISNNFIGVRSNGYDGGSNANGVVVRGYANTIDGNVISGNRADGVVLDGPGAVGNLVELNRIGTTASGGCPAGASGCNGTLPNERMGVMVQDTARDNEIADNTIAYSGDDGVRVLSGVHNRIRRNLIYGSGALALDLDANGVSANDNDGALIGSTVANRLVNYPELGSAGGGPNAGTLTGTVRSTNGTYRLDIYLNPSCDGSAHGEGTVRLKTVVVTIDNAPAGQNGVASFSTALAYTAPSGNPLSDYDFSATATDADGNTSEFSACVAYTLQDGLFANGFE